MNTKVAVLVNSAKVVMFSLFFVRLRKNYYYQFSQNCRKGGWEGWVAWGLSSHLRDCFWGLGLLIILSTRYILEGERDGRFHKHLQSDATTLLDLQDAVNNVQSRIAELTQKPDASSRKDPQQGQIPAILWIRFQWSSWTRDRRRFGSRWLWRYYESAHALTATILTGYCQHLTT